MYEISRENPIHTVKNIKALFAEQTTLFRFYTIRYLKLKNTIINELVMKTKKIILPESQMPTQWYNIVSDMKNRPLPPLNPATKEPVTLEQMSALFSPKS